MSELHFNKESDYSEKNTSDNENFHSTILQPVQFEPEKQKNTRGNDSHEKETKHIDASAADLLHVRIGILNWCKSRKKTHMFQPSRFEQETPVLRGCLQSSHLISKSSILRETCQNFQFFLKIPTCIASYFVFWCFRCIAAIGNANNTL